MAVQLTFNFNPPLAYPRKLTNAERANSRKAFSEFLADAREALYILGEIPDAIVEDYIKKDPIGAQVGLRVGAAVVGATTALAQGKANTDAND